MWVLHGSYKTFVEFLRQYLSVWDHMDDWGAGDVGSLCVGPAFSCHINKHWLSPSMKALPIATVSTSLCITLELRVVHIFGHGRRMPVGCDTVCWACILHLLRALGVRHVHGWIHRRKLETLCEMTGEKGIEEILGPMSKSCFLINRWNLAAWAAKFRIWYSFWVIGPASIWIRRSCLATKAARFGKFYPERCLPRHN